MALYSFGKKTNYKQFSSISGVRYNLTNLIGFINLSLQINWHHHNSVYFRYNDGNTETFLGDFNKNSLTKVSWFIIQHFKQKKFSQKVFNYKQITQKIILTSLFKIIILIALVILNNNFNCNNLNLCTYLRFIPIPFSLKCLRH